MTKEEWVKECGFFENEYYLIGAIKKYLLKEEQKEKLLKVNLSISDILNGRFYEEDSILIESLFEDWNNTLGWNEFNL